VNAKQLLQLLGAYLKMKPELNFVQKKNADGAFFWTLVNTGCGTNGDVLVTEFGEKDRVLNYVNIGPVAAATEVTLPGKDFRYCVTLRAEYADRGGKKTLLCAWYKNTVVNRQAPTSGASSTSLSAYPGITRKRIYA
jgi:hypothetical protein